MNTILRTTCALLISAVCTLPAHAETPSGQATHLTETVQIDSGPIKGRIDGKLQSYLGIPYAAPPVGELRWKPPVSPAPWTAERQATAYGESCPQNADLGVFGKPGGVEDCLTLNVFASQEALQAKEKLPVLVWIHGGSLWVGAARDYNPEKLAIEGKAVVVTLNYRLGLLGFFATPALKREGHAVGNFGLMDQQFALDWVQRNIAAFGGDPDNVTISGESSGGNSVMAHVISPKSAGKFQHAISMSGSALILRYPTFGAARPLEVAEQVGDGFAKAVGCDTNDLNCLRALPLKTILSEQTPYLINQTIIDGETIPMHPGDALKSGKFNRVTLVNGTTRDEGAFFTGFVENATQAPLTQTSYKDLMKMYFGEHTDAVAQQYPLSDYNTPSDATSAAITDMLMSCPAKKANEWTAAYTPTHAFEFADRTAPSYLEPTSFALGAAHTFELPYLFPGFHGGAGKPVTLNPLQERLSSEMVKYWTSAAQLGAQDASWPKYDSALENYMTFVLPTSRVNTHTFAKSHHCAFWDALGIY